MNEFWSTLLLGIIFIILATAVMTACGMSTDEIEKILLIWMI